VAESTANNLKLDQLGWRPFFQQQISLEQWEYPVLRVIAQYRNRLEMLGDSVFSVAKRQAPKWPNNSLPPMWIPCLSSLR
jgi:hypothetical protein